MSDPVFLIGAGFNKDAKAEAGTITGKSIYLGEYEIDADYPLLGDLMRLCFPDASPNQSIEQLFAEAIAARDRAPLETLYKRIMHVDGYLAERLLDTSRCGGNCYARFVEHFNRSSFLTFNYDSLVELFLLRLGRWQPRDGYGVPVEAEVGCIAAKNFVWQPSISLVLHLHGSLCIYPSEILSSEQGGNGVRWLSIKEQPDFIFDPDSMANQFTPYRRILPKIGYRYIWERVIAPVPDKAEGLRGKFVQAVYAKARELLDGADTLIAIGYSFNPHDECSYAPILKRFAGCVVVVDPAAEALCRRLRSRFPTLEWNAVVATLKEWVDSGFPGVSPT